MMVGKAILASTIGSEGYRKNLMGLLPDMNVAPSSARKLRMRCETTGRNFKMNRQGRTMVEKPSASVSKIVFSGGQEFTFKPGEKVILVGPNNSGKSQTLREIVKCASAGPQARPIVLKGIELHKTGTWEDLDRFLRANAQIKNDHYHYKDWAIHVQHVQIWQNPHLPNNLTAGFIKNIDANNRLAICDLQNILSDEDQRTRPQHLLYDSAALLSRISDLFRQAFGQELMINYRGGSKIPIHVGNKPPEAAGHPLTDEYVTALRENPLLHEQGDGVKSYAGILFEAVVSETDIILIDEPEAFLHPPQMRKLGGTLASEVRGQLFVATHSSDIMRGFLEGTKGNIRMLRIRREDGRNYVEEAEPETVTELWNTPILRYSNALEGIFHEQAILCEDHSDCRLFNAVADHLAEAQTDRWLDTAYIPAGGKHAIPIIASILRRIGVPTKAVFDIDILRSRDDLRKSVEAFGGNWPDISGLWDRLNAAVSTQMPTKNNDEMKTEITRIIEGANPGELPKSKISDAMKQGSAWSIVKRIGPTGLPRGEVRNSYRELEQYLVGIGIYLVPVGEVEEFCPDIGGHGPKFVNKVLTEMDLADPRLEALRTFVQKFHHGPHAPIGNEPANASDSAADESAIDDTAFVTTG